MSDHVHVFGVFGKNGYAYCKHAGCTVKLAKIRKGWIT